jgi:hypothetical protein
MKFPIKNISLNLIAALFIFLFTYTAISKLTEHDLFRNTLSKSPLIGSYAGFVSIVLPITELIVAALLFFPKTKLAGFISSLSLMFMFTGYLAWLLLFTKNLPCSCGGVLQQLSWLQHLWFNIFFTVLAGLGIYLHRRKRISFHSSLA